MGDYAQDMRSRLPPGLRLPDEIGALFDWIEARGLLHSSQRVAGDRFGTLQPLDAPRVGAMVLFRVETQAQAAAQGWFGSADDPSIPLRLVPFARTGSDGSHAAFWRDDAGAQHIVHLGSEGAFLCLGASPLDFLRLCAIGYHKISGEMLDGPGEPPDPSRATLNAPFVDWLVSTYGVSIPATASEIIGDPPGFDTVDHSDPFWRWAHARSS